MSEIAKVLFFDQTKLSKHPQVALIMVGLLQAGYGRPSAQSVELGRFGYFTQMDQRQYIDRTEVLSVIGDSSINEKRQIGTDARFLLKITT